MSCDLSVGWWGAEDLLLFEPMFGGGFGGGGGGVGGVLALRGEIMCLRFGFSNEQILQWLKELGDDVFKYIYGCRHLNGGTENTHKTCNFTWSRHA